MIGYFEGTVTVEKIVHNLPAGSVIVIQTDAAIGIAWWNDAAGDYGDVVAVTTAGVNIVAAHSKARITAAVPAAVQIIQGPGYLSAEGIVVDGNGNLMVNAIIFEDSGGVSLADQAFGLNSQGEPVVHNGEDDGNYLPSAEMGYRIRSVTNVTGAENIAGVTKLLGRFPVPASMAVNGQRFIVSGSLSVVFATASNTPSYCVGFVPSTITPVAGDGIGQLNGATSAVQMFPIWSLDMHLDGAVGEYALSAANSSQGALFTGGLSGAVSVGAVTAPNISFNEVGPLATSHYINLNYIAPPTPSAPSCTIVVDVTITPVAP